MDGHFHANGHGSRPLSHGCSWARGKRRGLGFSAQRRRRGEGLVGLGLLETNRPYPTLPVGVCRVGVWKGRLGSVSATARPPWSCRAHTTRTDGRFVGSNVASSRVFFVRREERKHTPNVFKKMFFPTPSLCIYMYLYIYIYICIYIYIFISIYL